MKVPEANDIYTIKVENLSKNFIYYEKEKGIKGSLKNLFNRKNLYKKVLMNISFKIKSSEIVGLIGLNGAGKTTTLKILSGIIAPSDGKVEVLGYLPFEKKKEFLKNITMIMGNKSQLQWDLPAIDTFELNRIIYDVEEKEYKNTIEELSTLLKVKYLLNTQVRRLSLGERMKMELIASLIHKPRILFLDEPTIGLDIITQYNIHDFLKQYCKKYHSTILLTSHNLNDIINLCDTLILINDGKIIYADSFAKFQKKFLNKKYLTLKFKKFNNEKALSKLEEITKINQVNSNSISILIDDNDSITLLKNIFDTFLEELEDINIENISINDVIRKIYEK
jgi:ABC superfamily ATP binding cassette transporter, ABC protein